MVKGVIRREDRDREKEEESAFRRSRRREKRALREDESFGCTQYNLRSRKIIKPQTPPPPPSPPPVSEPQIPPAEPKIYSFLGREDRGKEEKRDEVCGETGVWSLDNLFKRNKLNEDQEERAVNHQIKYLPPPSEPQPPPTEPPIPPTSDRGQEEKRDEVCGETGVWSLDNLFPSRKRDRLNANRAINHHKIRSLESPSPSPPPPSEPQPPSTEPKIQQHFVPSDFTTPANNFRSMPQQEDVIKRIVKEYEEAHTTPAMEASSNEYNLKEWTSWANTALDYYNNKLGTKFKLVKIIGVVSDARFPLRLVHINFKAKSDDDGSYRNFFAEMRVPWITDDDVSFRNFFAAIGVPWKDQLHEPIVDGCCTLEKTDSGEDLNVPVCSLCSGYFHQPHPTPRYGCRSSSGDLFANMASYY